MKHFGNVSYTYVRTYGDVFSPCSVMRVCTHCELQKRIKPLYAPWTVLCARLVRSSRVLGSVQGTLKEDNASREIIQSSQRIARLKKIKEQGRLPE